MTEQKVILRLKDGFYLESAIQPPMLDHEIDRLCNEALNCIHAPAWVPGINSENYCGELPDWIIGDDPYEPGDETAAELVVHATFPRFVAAVYDAQNLHKAEVRFIELWDSIAACEHEAWCRNALAAFRNYCAASDKWLEIEEQFETAQKVSH